MENLNHIENIILNYLQGSISEDDMRSLDIWITKSNDNKKLFFEMKSIYDLRKGGSNPSKEEIAQSMGRLNKKMDAANSIKNQKTKIP